MWWYKEAMLNVLATDTNVIENGVFLSCWNVRGQMHLTEKDPGNSMVATWGAFVLLYIKKTGAIL